MKERFQIIEHALKPHGFRRKRNTFWRLHDSVFHIIEFQKSPFYHSSYYINLAVHHKEGPIWQPHNVAFYTKPDATTAMIRIRIQQEAMDLDEESTRLAIAANIDTYIEWFQTVSTPFYLTSMPFTEYEKLTTTVPLFWVASFHMYRFYAYLELGDLQLAKEELIHFEQHLLAYPTYQQLLGEAKHRLFNKGGKV